MHQGTYPRTLLNQRWQYLGIWWWQALVSTNHHHLLHHLYLLFRLKYFTNQFVLYYVYLGVRTKILLYSPIKFHVCLAMFRQTLTDLLALRGQLQTGQTPTCILEQRNSHHRDQSSRSSLRSTLSPSLQDCRIRVFLVSTLATLIPLSSFCFEWAHWVQLSLEDSKYYTDRAIQFWCDPNFSPLGFVLHLCR